MSGERPRYVELQVTTHFSFLRGASSPEELFSAAALLGLPALGVTDRNTVGGLVRAWDGQKVTGVRSIVGCRLDLVCGTALLVYPSDRDAYSRLCRLLTIGKRRAGKGACHLHWSDVEEWNEGMIGILVPDRADATNEQALSRLARMFGNRAYMALSLRRRPKDAIRLRDLAAQAAAARVPIVATGDVLYHSPDRRLLQDVVSCIREKCTIDQLGRRRERFADRHLKDAAEMERLFARYLGDARPVARSVELAERCGFGLEQLTYTYPDEIGASGLTPQAELERLTWAKAPERYPDGLTPKIRSQLEHELKLIAGLDYAPYFLTVHSIVAFARSKNILCQGRGSAANSAVCYVLGITSIDPVKSELLFERFVSAERREPPDIDVDFEHERREEVIQWIYETYGRDRSALTAVISRFRARGAVREVGKALGLTEDVTAGLASQVWGWSREGVEERHAAELNLDLGDRRLALTLELAKALIDTPRHTSQHPGGFVLTLGRLDELVPIEPAAMVDRQIIEWDKDDIDALGFMKVDVLGLGMLGCMRRAFTLLEEDGLAHGEHDMRVRLGIAVGADIPMHVDVGDHAARDKLLGHEVPGERDALLPGHLARNRELDLAGELRVLALFGRLNLVPQRRPVMQTLGRARRQHDLGMDDAGLVRKVVMAVEPLVMEAGGGAIGGGRDGTGAGAAADQPTQLLLGGSG